ncbi:bifunctional riboflavin kinase/FAD synthetase [Tepidibacter formicigenes]|uniref:Riboflavin biosynthesis protein n=1 Tax=Tepidibacter formicigenes DSM 15518 TaxID=1123349 RepID=A0A1M6JD30_9FIRM|nr:bifunctional riboflavin kinase/FAD synthetase [Tepidibacter formicigenes]SHJ44534.1 riboflavin kinase / FMN adenylyltransferase [Tepidibacter formicigenes DSM 15518]
MKIVKDLKKINLKNNTVVTIGNFDGVHIGHQNIINKTISIAKEKNLKSILFTFSNHPINFFVNDSIKNLMTIQEKYNFIKNMGIDIVLPIPFNESIIKLTPDEYIEEILIKRLKVKELIIGHDFKFGKNRGGNADFLKKVAQIYDFNVRVIEPIKIENIRVSSTYIRKLLEEGNIKRVRKFLGREYNINGVVVHGKKVGRKLGFPTINLKVDEDILIPKIGVYRTKVKIENDFYDGATNIGYTPTIQNKNFSIETYIIDYNGDLYKKEVSLYFIERIRDEIQFKTIEELRNQMKNDVEKIKRKKYIYL